jgi:hypothetical protein
LSAIQLKSRKILLSRDRRSALSLAHARSKGRTTMNADLEAAVNRTGRSCGQCSLCCKLPEIVVLNKPANVWCQHCKPGKGGCSIYDTRPEKCQNFGCGWLTDRSFDDDWFPARAKIYVASSRGPGGRVDVLVSVDPAYPNRWREAPYFDRILRMAARRGRVVVSVGLQVITVRPNEPPHDPH